MLAPSAAWPFVGRTSEAEIARSALGDPNSAGVLLLGPAGVGKTRLLDEVAAGTLRGTGPVVRLVGAAATRHIPFAALAGSVPDALGDGSGPPDVVRVILALRELIAARTEPGERALLVVDDIALLDDASLAVITQLVTTGAVALVATMRDDETPPSGVASIERAIGLRRLHLSGLDATEVGQLLEATLAGPAEPTTIEALWQASLGNPLFLRELVHAATAAGSLVQRHGHWRLEGPLRASSRLAETVGERLAGLSPTARELCETLALAEPLHVDDLDRAGWSDAALSLEAAGLLDAETIADRFVVRLAHPLYGEVLREALTPLRRRQLLLAIAGIVTSRGQVDDALRISTWLLDAEATVPADLLRRAARRARAARDFVLTERLAGAACAHEPDVEMLTLHGEALYSLGRLADAERVVAGASPLVRTDLERWSVATLHHRILMWGTLEVDRSIDVLREAAARMQPGPALLVTTLSIANALAFHDDPAGALELLGSIGDTGADDPDLQLLGSFVRSVALTRVGDPVTAARVAVDLTRGDEAVDASSGRPHPGLIDLAHAFALIETGSLDTAWDVADQGYRSTVAEHDPQMHVWFPLVLARQALRSGRPVTARRWFTEALSEAAAIRFAAGRRMGLAGLAICAGQLGDTAAAEAALAEIDELQPEIRFLAPETGLGIGWALHTLGRQREAVATVVAAADRAHDDGDATLCHHLLYEALRLGAPAALADRMRQVQVSGALAVARQSFADGVLCGDGDLLAAAETRFAILGAALSAAESAALLAVELDRAGRARDAAASRVRSRDHAASCEGAVTPLLAPADDATPLTAREREVAELAARGLPSKIIARELGLSVRTVSNHLQHAFVKLGVSTRAELPDALQRAAQP